MRINKFKLFWPLLIVFFICSRYTVCHAWSYTDETNIFDLTHTYVTFGIAESNIFSLVGESTALSGLVVERDAFNDSVNPLSGATVMLSGVGTASSDSDGEFQFGNLPAGTYAIEVEKTGYYLSQRQITLSSGENSYDVFYLTKKSSSALPVAYNFESPQGSHFIEGMPGNLTFRTMIAWNGSSGSVRFLIGGEWEYAVITDLGGGLALAELTIAAPESLSFCSELTIEVKNGEGEITYINTGVHFSSTSGLIPWYRDNIWWTPSGNSLSYSKEISFSFDLPLPEDVLGFDLHFGFEKKVKYDLLSATFEGSLGGKGGFGFKIPMPQPEVKILGGGDIGVEGTLENSLAGCGPPQMIASWSLSFSGKAGVEAPVVIALDAIAPGVGSTLASVPLIKKIKLQLFMVSGSSLSGSYDGSTIECFLGATSTSGEFSMGAEATAVIGNDDVNAGVYVGGDGSLGIDTCPDFAISSYTGRIYVGAFANLYGLEIKKEVSADISWDFTRMESAREWAVSDLAKGLQEGTWEPIGQKPLKWGETNRLALPMDRARGDDDGIKQPTGTAEELLVENVIFISGPSVFADDTESMILYAHHDTEKPWHAATDIGRVYKEGAGPWMTDLVTDDLAAEFSPAMEKTDADTILAAWMRVDGDISGAASPEEISPYMEIVASWYDTTSGSFNAPIQLTANSVLDRSPQPVGFGANQGLVWVQNQGNLMIGDATYGDSLMYSQWTGTYWAAPETLWSAQKGITGYSFGTDSLGQGHIVLSVDEDGDPDTEDDRELYQISTNGGVWQASFRLTDNMEEDSLPVLVSPNNMPMLVWKADATMKYTPLDTWAPKDVYTKDTLANEAPTLDGIAMPGGAAIAYTVQSPDGINMVAAFYDANLDQWSLPRQLTHDDGGESSLSMTFNGENIVIAYLKTQTLREEKEVEIDGQVQTIHNVPQPGRTDLYVLRHTIGNDLSVSTDSISLTPENPAPGTTVNVDIAVDNIGDLPVETIIVALYDGDPDASGIYIDEAVLTGPVVAGYEAVATVPWDIPSDLTAHQLFVVVDPDLAIDDRDRTNNAASTWMCLPDMLVETSESNLISSDTVSVTTRVTNNGVVPSGDFDLSWQLYGPEGDEIGRTTVTSINPGSSKDVVFKCTVDAPIQPGHFIPVCAVIDPDDTVLEFDETNNTGMVSVKVPMYTDQVGTVIVNILPPDAATAGVKWSFDNGLTWYGSETSVSLLSGSYSIIFNSADTWYLPPIHNVTVQTGQDSLIIADQALIGDLNADGSVGLDDAMAGLMVISGGQPDVPVNFGADADTDGSIGIKDVIHILEEVAARRE